MKLNSVAVKVLHKANISRHVSQHLIGEHHTESHHKAVGLVIMVIGVLIAKSAHHIEVMIVHIGADVVGYALHGIGLIPFIGGLEKEKNNNTNKTQENEL